MSRVKAFNIQSKMHEVLKANPEISLTSREIATRIFEIFPEDCKYKKYRSTVVETDEQLIQQMAREIGAHWKRIVRKYTSIRTSETRPRKFYFTHRSEETEAHETELTVDDMVSERNPLAAFSEHDLYPLLGDYIFQELNCVSMRVDESKSSNSKGKRGNHWLFPDIVGMIDLSSGWHSGVNEMASSLAADRVHLVSIEVKKTVNRSNVREVLFQTVSNSTWANYAYLAAANLESKANDELQLLCLAHGVGFILLNSNDPSESQVLIPARYNDKVNYNSFNRLVQENKDAQEFADNVDTFIKTRKLRTRDWDLVPKRET